MTLERSTGRRAVPALRAAPLGLARIDALRTALAAAGLPADDIAAAGVELFEYAIDGRPVGYGGLERHGPDVLLRSIVVAADRRGEGVGRGIVCELLDRAADRGAERAYLLTTSAQSFFERLGFAGIERHLAPAPILATRQASSLCPASAALMAKTLAPGGRNTVEAPP